MAEWYERPLQLVETLCHAILRIGNDEDVRRLRTMAEGCRRMRTALLAADDDLTPVNKLLDLWEGEDAATFKAKYARFLDREYRLQAIAQLGEASTMLDSAAEISVSTKRALEELLKSLIIAVVAAAAIAAVTAGMGTLAAWARSAKTVGDVAFAATGTLGRFQLVFRLLGGLLRSGTILVGRSRVVRGLGTAASESRLTFLQMARGSWSSYWQLYRWGLGGNVAINVVANPFRGRHPLDRSLLSLAEGSNSAIVGGAVGGIGSVAVFAAMKPWKRNLIQGALASGGSTFWNDRVENKSWEQTAKDVAVSTALAGSLNVLYVGIGESKLVNGLGSEGWRRWWSSLPPLAKGYVMGFPGNVTMRVTVPWAAKPEPLDLPKGERLPGGESSE